MLLRTRLLPVAQKSLRLWKKGDVRCRRHFATANLNASSQANKARTHLSTFWNLQCCIEIA